jgi:hypothetical protein
MEPDRRQVSKMIQATISAQILLDESGFCQCKSDKYSRYILQDLFFDFILVRINRIRRKYLRTLPWQGAGRSSRQETGSTIDFPEQAVPFMSRVRRTVFGLTTELPI